MPARLRHPRHLGLDRGRELQTCRDQRASITIDDITRAALQLHQHGFVVGATSLLARGESLERWLSLPFGVGLALTTDELPLLYGRTNPYWGDNGEHFALAQGAGALLVSLGLGWRFLRRGLTAPPDAGMAARYPHPRVDEYPTRPPGPPILHGTTG